jgi:plastocyanin
VRAFSGTILGMKMLLALAVLASCGGGDDGGNDAQPADTAPGPKVVQVSPCTGESATINTLDTRFDPTSVTISAGQIVKFVNEVTHDIKPALTGTTDEALVVPEGQTRCFRFNDPGTFGFRCAVHGFVGSVVVN